MVVHTKRRQTKDSLTRYNFRFRKDLLLECEGTEVTYDSTDKHDIVFAHCDKTCKLRFIKIAMITYRPTGVVQRNWFTIVNKVLSSK